jgi:CDP-diacylglycerol---serine O-phosphatidyltransferase
MRPIRTIAVFPTLLTLGNLICGFFAIVVAARIENPVKSTGVPTAIERTAEGIEGMVDVPADAAAAFEGEDVRANEARDARDARNLMISGWLIFLAMVFDGLDGYVARLARTTSDFGAELDSLCDVVSFGVAPGFLLVKMCPKFTVVHNQTIWIIAAAYAACAALRLARFNVETTDDDEHLHFSGLPTPAAAAVIAGFAIMFYKLRWDIGPQSFREGVDSWLQYTLPFFGLMLAALMVSRIRYPHVTNRVLRGQRSFGHVVAVVFFFVAIMVARGYALPVAAAAFAIYGPAHLAWEKWVERRQRDEPIF